MIYIASPYSDKSFAVREKRHRSVEALTAFLLRNKVWCFSPIVHCHELATQHEMPTDHAYWKEYDEHMLSISTAILVHEQEGWENSVGVTEEIKYANSINLRLFFYDQFKCVIC